MFTSNNNMYSAEKFGYYVVLLIITALYVQESSSSLPEGLREDVTSGRITTTLFPQYTRPSTTKPRHKRTTPVRISFHENCDYLAHYCLKAYTTGKLCGRTLYYTYHTFNNYCLLDYVNCMERYEVWQVVHMGECFTVTEVEEYMRYPYDDDYFLDQYYVLEEH